MKTTELIIIALVHLMAFTVVAAIIHIYQIGDPGLSLVMGATVGALTAAMLYHRKVPEHAPFLIKASAGAVLSVMAIITGLISQALLEWMPFPEVTISVSAIGSFFFPWAVFGSMQKAYRQKK